MPELNVSSRAQDIPMSAIRMINDRAREMQHQGISVIHFDIGEPDQNTPESVREAAKLALDEGYTHYTENAGLFELREAISAKLHEDGLFYDPKEIIVTVGSNEASLITALALVDHGDEVLLLSPSFTLYSKQIRLAGGNSVEVPLRSSDFQIDESAIESAINAKTKAIWLNTPHNPTGTVLSRESLEAISKVVTKHGLWVVSDEIYQDLVYDGAKHCSIATLPGMKDRTVTINGFSKSYAMTGWRLGYCAAPRALVPYLVKMHQCCVTCATSFAQRAALDALAVDTQWKEQMRTIYQRRRDTMYSALHELSVFSCVKPSGAFYMFVDISRMSMPSLEAAHFFLEKAHVATVPGKAFGSDRHLRLAYTLEEGEIRRGVRSMKDALVRRRLLPDG